MDKAQSTKQTSTSSKRRRVAIANAIQETSKRLRNSSEQEDTIISPSNEKQTTLPNANAPKKKRGPTQVKMIPEHNYHKMDLEFNEYEQVVGQNSDKFASIIGAMVREHVPVVIKDWHSVDGNKKMELWTFIQQRFNVSDCHQRMTFQCMGRYWRTFKSRLRKEIRAQVESSVNIARTIALLRPKNVNSEPVWVKFVEDTLSADFQEKSSRFSNMRANQKLLHTMGRKGYPRVAYEMRKKNPDIKGLRTRVWTRGHFRKDGKPINEAVADTLRRIEDCAVSISNTPAEDSIRDDAVARILGLERHGRVRGLGFGVAPSKVDGQIQSSGRIRELESQIQTQTQRMGALEEKMENFLKLSQQNVEDGNSNALTPQSLQGSTIPMTNARCQLLHWYMFEDEEIVGEGKIATTDPSAKVHHLPLGRDCWKVWVEEVYMDNLTLYRPTDECRTLSEAMGSTVAWPKSSIRLL